MCSCSFNSPCKTRLTFIFPLGLKTIPENIPDDATLLDLQNNKITEIKENDFKNLKGLHVRHVSPPFGLFLNLLCYSPKLYNPLRNHRPGCLTFSPNEMSSLINSLFIIHRPCSPTVHYVACASTTSTANQHAPSLQVHAKHSPIGFSHSFKPGS